MALLWFLNRSKSSTLSFATSIWFMQANDTRTKRALFRLISSSAYLYLNLLILYLSSLSFGLFEFVFFSFLQSVYPPLFTMGLPKRHHIVVYLLAESNRTCAELNEELKLDENEVDAVAWLDEDIVKQICQSDEHGKAVKTTGKFFEWVLYLNKSLCLIHNLYSTLSLLWYHLL